MASSKGEDWVTRVTRKCMAEYAAEAKAVNKLRGDMNAAAWLEKRRREELAAAAAATQAAEATFHEANNQLKLTRAAAFRKLQEVLDAGPPEGEEVSSAPMTGMLVDALSGEAVACG